MKLRWDSEQPSKEPFYLSMHSISRTLSIELESYWESISITGKLRQQQESSSLKHLSSEPSFLRVQRMKGLIYSLFATMIMFSSEVWYSSLEVLKLLYPKGIESRMRENSLFCPRLKITPSQKYRDHSSAPIAPSPLPVNANLLNLARLYFLIIRSILDLTILFPRKQRSFPLYLVGLAANPWNNAPSQDGMMIFSQFSKAGSARIPEVMFNWGLQNEVTQLETVMQLSRVEERELPPQKVGVGVGMKWIIRPQMLDGGEDGRYRKLCAPLRHIAWASALFASFVKRVELVKKQ